MADEKTATPPKHAGGRPAIWTSPEVLEKLIEQYFENQKRPTLAGLAYALDISRSTLYAYGEKDKFSDIIKKARQKVEMLYEDILTYGDRPTGVIFALKNMGWKDRTDVTTNDRDIPSPIYGGASTK